MAAVEDFFALNASQLLKNRGGAGMASVEQGCLVLTAGQRGAVLECKCQSPLPESELPRGLHQWRRDVTGSDLGSAYSILLFGEEGENKASL